MKTKNIFLTLFILICAVAILGCANTHNVKTDNAIDSITVRNMIESQSFVFIARYVNAVGVRSRNLSGGYEISISKDTIKSYLPFFGRGYVAPISPADVDFDFISTKFTNTTRPARRRWNISIKPKDQKYLTELYFIIFDNASASLTVTSNDHSSISYNGYITERKLNKEKK